MGVSKDLEGVSIVEQIRLALKLLSGYPSIKDVIDIKAARRFLEMLEGTEARYIPKFSEVDKEKIQMIRKELEGNLEEWKNALENLPYASLTCLEGEETGLGEGIITECYFPEDRSEIGEDEETNGDCMFLEGNRARITGMLYEFENKELEFEGTWAEVYIKLADHLNLLASKLSIPPFPNELKK